MRPVLLFYAAMVLAGCATVPLQHADNTFVPSSAGNESGAYATYLSARFAASEYDLRNAARYYSETLRRDPSNAALLEQSFLYSAMAGDFATAVGYAERLVAVSPDDRQARLLLAVTALQKRDYEAARRHITQSARGPLTTLIVSLLDAWAAAGMKDQPSVEKNMKTLATEKGAENIAAFHLGLLAEFAGNNEAAETAYRQAMRTAATPRVVDAYGRMLERAGRAADAAALYRQVQNQGGFLPVVQPGLERLEKNMRPEPLVASPADGFSEALFGLAASLNDTGSADISVLYLRLALQLRPGFALGYILLGDRFDQLRRFEDAVEAYRAVPANSPYRRMAVMAAALDLTRLERHDDAVSELRRMVASNPADIEAWIAMGDAYRATDKDPEALDAFNRAITALGTPAARDWRVFYARAIVKDRLKDWPAAEADIQTALKLQPNEAQLLNYLGYSWVDRGERLPEAMAMLERAIKLRPNDGYIMDSVGWAYYRLGRYEDAARTLGQAVLLTPGDPTINDHLGDALWRTGRRVAARYQWNHALTFGAEGAGRARIEQKIKMGLPDEPAPAALKTDTAGAPARNSTPSSQR